jgi:hypothetical protein
VPICAQGRQDWILILRLLTSGKKYDLRPDLARGVIAARMATELKA